MKPTPSAPTDEERRVITAWNATAADRWDGVLLHERFQQQVMQSREEIAAIFGDQVLTYAELNRRANRLAHLLRERPIAANTRVGVSLRRSFEMLVAVLGVLKAGAAYVPLDPALPAERLGYMIADPQLALIITETPFVESLKTHGAPLLVLDQQAAQLAEQPDTDAPATPFADNLVYVTYTSGSTGRPKGIEMTQRPLLNLLGWMLRTTELPTRARTLQFASLSFDVSFQDIFSTWLSGGALVLISEAQRQDLAGLPAVIERHGVHRIFLPAVALQQFSASFCAGNVSCRTLRRVISGSEQLVISDAIRRMFTALPECSLHNEYGPSETHVVTALAMPPDPGEWVKRPAVGKPIANTQLHVLDSHGEPVPVGEPGELYIGGSGLARGYTGLPELTAERFIPDRFQAKPGARLYRTGDQARWLATGDLEFIGRLDHQIKIRGYRVEPGDIESALERHPLIRETCVLARESTEGEKRLVAYLVAPGARPSASAVRAFLAEKLPDYMIPGAYVFLRVFPLNANGKINRAALPAPDTGRPALAVEFVAPTGETEQFLARLWREILRLDRVGVLDNLFDLGGDSVIVVQMHQRLEQHLARQFPIAVLFEHTTIASLARYFTDQDTRGTARQQSVAERAAKQRAAILRR